jgi:hypothetical protein
MILKAQPVGAPMKTVSIVVAAVVLSVGAAHGQSPQPGAAPDSVQNCQTQKGGCARLAGGNYESGARNLAGSMYKDRMSVGWSWNGVPGSRCPARSHSAGYC